MPKTNLLLSILIGVSLSSAVAAAAQERPNVVVIIGDDHGWPNSGFMPSPQVLSTNQGEMPVQDIVSTPNLDSLASQGVTFRRGYSTGSLCVPSLRTFLSASGLHSVQWLQREAELESVPQIGTIATRRESQFFRTVPRELERHGYLSWEGGKMWSGTFEDAGFTHGLATSVGGPFDSVGDQFGREGWDTATCGSTAAPETSCPALDPLREFLDVAQAEDKPFFVWFAPMLPHAAYNAPQEYRDPYEALGLQSFEVGYLSNVTWLDELIGELLGELDARGLRDDTLVIYASDNGWGLGFQFFAGAGKGKGTLYDLGFRTPIVFHWPGHVPEGAVYDDLVSTSDIPATVLDYAAGGDGPLVSEGVSLRDRIEGGPPVGRTEIVTHDAGDAVVTDTWRYLRFPDGHEELYRIDLDPFEEVDLAAANPGMVASLAAQAVDHLAGLLTSPPSTEISGRLIDPIAGEPLAGAELKLVGGPVTLVSIVGSDGWFRFGPLDGNLSYSLRRSRRVKNDFRWSSTNLGFVRVTPLAGEGIFNALAVTPSATGSAQYGARITGTVTAADTGDPIAGAVVSISGKSAGSSLKAQVATEPDGSFRIDNVGAAGTYRLVVAGTSTHRKVVVPEFAIGSPDEIVDLYPTAEPK